MMSAELVSAAARRKRESAATPEIDRAAPANPLTQDQINRARGALRSALLFANAIGAKRLSAQAADGVSALDGVAV